MTCPETHEWGFVFSGLRALRAFEASGYGELALEQNKKPLRGEARRLIARLGCVIDPAAFRIVENDLRE